MDEKKIIYTYRYMWKVVGADAISFKIVSDCLEGLAEFENRLLSLKDIEVCGKEYLHEYDCLRIGEFTSLKSFENKDENKDKNSESEVKENEKI